MTQAFPTLELGGNGLELTDPGMTLRDYFAAKAMQVVLAPNPATGQSPHVTDLRSIAEDAYLMADAMLKARQEPTQ
jgi:hypothetical protein